MKDNVTTIAARYAKIVEWSEEDGCFIGRVPALSYGGVHGDDPEKVFKEICQVAEEVVAIHVADGRRLPRAVSKAYSGKFVLRVQPGLHEALAMQAEATGRSLNATVQAAIVAGLHARQSNFSN